MKAFTQLLSLPTSLIALALLSSRVESHEEEWPYNLPRSAKYFPEHESRVRRGLEAQERLRWEAPAAVKKMGDDASEKFHFEYWSWDTEEGDSAGSFGASTEQYTNATVAADLLPALMPHRASHKRGFNVLGRSIFARGFECPSGTRSCSAIGSDLCCSESATCVNTSDGPGCCPSGLTCGDAVAGCDADAGFTSCPVGGGCCSPGGQCLDTGCVYYGTEVVTATSPRTTTAQPSRSSSPPANPTTVVSGYTTTVTVIISGEDRTETTTVVSTLISSPSQSSTCTSNFFSCASSLGGGCCRDGQACATDSCVDTTSTSTSQATAAPPVRPTTSDASVSAADTPTITTTSTSSLSPAAGCPVGFYMCSAVYLGGCCRVDRNCDTTSCPASETTAVVTGSGVTVGIAGQPPGGSCASGWMSCAASVGGGCCPTGYSCGASCVATISGVGDTSKIAPESAAVTEKVARVGFLGMAVLAGFGIVLL